MLLPRAVSKFIPILAVLLVGAVDPMAAPLLCHGLSEYARMWPLFVSVAEVHLTGLCILGWADAC